MDIKDRPTDMLQRQLAAYEREIIAMRRELKNRQPTPIATIEEKQVSHHGNPKFGTPKIDALMDTFPSNWNFSYAQRIVELAAYLEAENIRLRKALREHAYPGTERGQRAIDLLAEIDKSS